jgi:hypothetical protein
MVKFVNRLGGISQITGTLRFHAFGRVSIINEANGFTRRFDEDKIISITEI